MVKALSFFKRTPGLSVDAFQAHWRTVHAAVVTQLPGLRRYVQSPTIASGYRKGEPIYDGVAELWFDDTRMMHALAGTPEYAAVRADEAKFIDGATMGLIISDEHVIKDDGVPADAVKSVEFVTRRPQMEIDAFQRYWREVHGPLGAALSMVRRYVQSHTRRSIYGSGRTPPYDGAAITWFADTDAMRDSAKTPEYARVRADEPNFIVAPAPFIITRERVIVG
jgi:uncharacterized protein (TIGR02118 family)